ncbi:hypothetical protein BLNAU_22540 [Blattamonas nauphoetae]|uniref:Uncharacterized protein n=1 Tax=Blattamonas nauphoetae TaxID=2049346 RepID=A0ABQ9WTA2_9EUKA|nr:hypothetical protein BLNAU_22540 [Blattamonas nauphoetae]
MESSLNSVEHKTVPNDATPLFLRTDPKRLRTIEQASQTYQSLVDFVKEGNNLDNTATHQACTLLQTLSTPFSTFSSDQILFELVPAPDGSCSGLTNSIIPLLSSPNEKLILSTLEFLHCTVLSTDLFIHFDFLQTGFFALLPKSFYELEMHLVENLGFFLMRIVEKIMFCLDPLRSRELCEIRQLSMESFEQTVTNKFFGPIEPFLDFVIRNRQILPNFWDLPKMLDTLFRFSPSLPHTTQFVLSSSFIVPFTNSLIFVEHENFLVGRLRGLSLLNSYLWTMGPAVQKRRQQILSKLHEEGLWDEIELLMRCCRYDYSNRRLIFVGAQLIDDFGGNVPHLGEIDDEVPEDEWDDFEEEWDSNVDYD